VVRFLGLSEVAETAWGEMASFPLGVLYPYSRDLQRVCDRFDTVLRQCPEVASLFIGEARPEVASLSPEQLEAVNSYLESIATLYERIAFAPGTARPFGRDRLPTGERRDRSHDARQARRDRKGWTMTIWKYLIVALPEFKPPTNTPGMSGSVAMLNREGAEGWEAVGMTALDDGTVAVLLKTPVPDDVAVH
jgi:hypothetical protein